MDAFVVTNTPVSVSDEPRFAWRGMLLDSGESAGACVRLVFVVYICAFPTLAKVYLLPPPLVVLASPSLPAGVGDPAPN